MGYTVPVNDDPGCRPEVMARLRAKMREPRARPRAQRTICAVSGSGLPWLTRDLEIHKLRAEIQELRAEKSALRDSFDSVVKNFDRIQRLYDHALRLLDERKNQGK